jgi:hypothetical protein
LLGKFHPRNDQGFQGRISALLLEGIERFDGELGEGVKELCKKLHELTETKAGDLVESTQRFSVKHIMVLR